MEKNLKQNDLFTIINALFTDKQLIGELTYDAAKQNIFMVNRRLAIMYPEQAQVFNNAKCNPRDVLMAWSNFLYSPGGQPRWIYTKGAAKSTAEKIKINVPEAVKKQFMSRYNLSSRDYRDLSCFFPQELKKELETYYKLIEGRNEKPNND